MDGVLLVLVLLVLVLVPFGCVPGPARLKMSFPPLKSHMLLLILPGTGVGSGLYIRSANITVLLCHLCSRADDSLMASVQQDQEKKAVVMQEVGQKLRMCFGPQSCKHLGS